MAIKINDSYLAGQVTAEEIKSMGSAVAAAHNTLHEGTGAGNDFLGWLSLPTDYDKDEFARIQAAAEKIRSDSDILVVIGIGGSYLGARAAIEFLTSQNYNLTTKGTKIFYVGNSISPAALNEILAICAEDGVNFSVNVVSKSGTTTEPAIAFRLFRELLAKKYSDEKEIAGRIYSTTDKEKYALKQLSDAMGYESFVVPDNVGGRFSVLTAVGLLPIAVAGLDISKLMAGAKAAQDELCDTDLEKNPCYRYAAIRNVLYKKGYVTEVMVSYEPCMVMLSEWWKQLYGESEGKDGKGLFPASVTFSTDLHSLGQYIQEGALKLFETVCLIDTPKDDIVIKSDEQNIDGLNFLAGMNMSYVNKKAFEGTLLAHTEGGTPNIILSIPEISEFELGYLFYFFEKACAISGYIIDVNPFNQPGVEAYKKNMFALLGKPGFEGEKAALEAKLAGK
jgi:glucose-6-phosphate isomerase